MGVIVTEKEVIRFMERRGNNRVVMTNGCFDILHAGHVSLLQQAATQGALLLVAVNDDESVRRLKGNDRPVNKLESRMLVLAALECVDWVVPFSEDTPARLIELLSPDVLVKGGDYRPSEIAGAEHVRSYGGRIMIIQTPRYSTTELLNRFRDESSNS